MSIARAEYLLMAPAAAGNGEPQHVDAPVRGERVIDWSAHL
jgi:hypothetical protein